MARKSKPASGFLWTEEGEERRSPVARVALVRPLDRLYSYAVGTELTGKLQPGQRVVVPFGKRGTPAVAFCVEVSDEGWSSTLKPVAEILDPQPLLSPRLLELGRWTSRYYACPLGRTLAAMVPEPVRRQSGFRTVRRVAAVLSIEQASTTGRLGIKQRTLLERLTAGPLDVAELASAGIGPATIRSAEKRGVVKIEVLRVPRPGPDFDRPLFVPDYSLNRHQQAALARIGQILDEPRFRAVLLFGVSGSGKTEVYVRSIQRVLDVGRQAILLVPEIALTTQTVHRLSARFRDVAVIHSGLTGTQRSLTWADIASGRKRVVIGTRSAVFAPCCRLGLIVVDEEQESSYKNLQAPRFNTKDLAIKRAELENIPVLLGSATPSLETWSNCSRFEHFECLRLPERVAGLSLPKVHLVGLRQEHLEQKAAYIFSRLLEEKLQESLDRKEQAVLLINRRGYATFLVCSACRKRVLCPTCGISMVFHKITDRAQCHYCGQFVDVPRVCPDSSCGGALARAGIGTQRVEELLQRRFPSARIQRVDSDTMTRTHQYETIIRDFEAHRLDILVGTQMIAKGLDFPFVSFVGVVNADTTLSLPDFRAGERTFQLVTQVAGRAGRADRTDGGCVVVQTYNPQLPAIQAAVRHDFETFANGELAVRRRLRYPPFARMTRVVLADRIDSRVNHAAARFAETVKAAAQQAGIEVLIGGPQRCILQRMRDQYRYEVIFRTETAGLMQRLLDCLRAEKKLSARIASFIIDVDPVSLI